VGQRAQDSAASVVELTGVDQQAVTESCVLLGLDVNDDDSGNVHVHVHAGTDNTGALVCSAIPANGNHEIVWFGSGGVKCQDGIYVDVISGTPEGSIFYR